MAVLLNLVGDHVLPTVRRFLCLLALLCFVGCASHPGTKRYVIFGFGVVTVNTNQAVATVIHTTILGVGATTIPGMGAALGYGNSSAVWVNQSNNVNIEIKSSPFGAMKVNKQ